ncbi:MAG: ribosomal protein S18-alanine N-acetyltransferase [Rhizobiaceae bacterium]
MIWFPRRKIEIVVMEPEPDDFSRLAEIHAAGFNKAWDEDELVRLAAMPGAKLWIAKEYGKGDAGALGFVLVRNSGQEAEIITIATKPVSRKHGIGRALMDHVIRELHRERVQKLFLEVDATNQAAISLYLKLGFEQVGKREAYYSNTANDGKTGTALASDGCVQGTDALVMSLDLR